MDVILSSSSVKLLSAAIASFSRIAGGGNVHPNGASDIYWEFDPITGLEIRTMNDAKTAYACMTYQPSFFIYCSTPSENTTLLDDTQSSLNDHSSSGSPRSSTDTKRSLTCRIALKALVPIVRNRKNVDTLRIRSCSLMQHTNENDSVLGLEFMFTFRNDDNESSSFIRRNHVNYHPTEHYSTEGQRMAIHRVHVVDTTVVSVVVAHPTLHDRTLPPSELVVAPIVLLRLLEPLQRTVEVALIVRSGGGRNSNPSHNNDDDITLYTNNGLGSVSISSFHHSDTIQNDTTEADPTTNNNAILQATTASLLKTETTCTADEFVEFDFVSNRRLTSEGATRNTDLVATTMPDDVNEEVILVFSIKEAKSMLQLCSTLSQQQQASSLTDLLVHVSFHWGGQPMSIQMQTDTYTIQLVLATLDYKLLTSMRTTATTTNR